MNKGVTKAVLDIVLMYNELHFIISVNLNTLKYIYFT